MGDAAATELVPPWTKATNVFMNTVVHPDGTVTRPEVPVVPPSESAAGAVLSRDVPLDAALGTYLRLYLPDPVPGNDSKLPVILYFHGGGFVLFSPATAFYHGFCEAMAGAVPALVASLEYRLAPEHRLPAAYDDAAAAVRWLRDAAPGDPWVSARGDLARCFAMGSSAGGNMAFFAGVRTRDDGPVRGLLLHQPYLGGVERTESEAASADDGVLPLEANDKLWSLALPAGADRDHEFCNPARSLPHGAVAGLPRCLVTGNAADPLVDRQREFAGWLRDRGVDVVAKTESKGYHAVELFVPDKAQELCDAVRDFVFA
jgi:acetyl esterase/lipase